MARLFLCDTLFQLQSQKGLEKRQKGGDRHIGEVAHITGGANLHTMDIYFSPF